jgi:hypothetical protein
LNELQRESIACAGLESLSATRLVGFFSQGFHTLPLKGLQNKAEILPRPSEDATCENSHQRITSFTCVSSSIFACRRVKIAWSIIPNSAVVLIWATCCCRGGPPIQSSGVVDIDNRKYRVRTMGIGKAKRNVVRAPYNYQFPEFRNTSTECCVSSYQKGS